jgi:hypothetical protein
MKTLLIILALFLPSCATLQKRTMEGGTAEERAMVHGAFNSQIPFLRSRGFNVPDRRDQVRLHPRAADGQVRLKSGRVQGYFNGNDGRKIGGRAKGFWIEYARPTTPEMFDHEVKHLLLGWGGYHALNEAHDRRAFPEGGTIR